jgi:hypothetical protein
MLYTFTLLSFAHFLAAGFFYPRIFTNFREKNSNLINQSGQAAQADYPPPNPRQRGRHTDYTSTSLSVQSAQAKRAESPKYTSVGFLPLFWRGSGGGCPTNRNMKKNEALKGRHPDYALSGLNMDGGNPLHRALPCAIDNKAFSLKSSQSFNQVNQGSDNN